MFFVTPSSPKSSIFKMFSVHTKTNSRRFQLHPFQSLFKKLRSCDGLEWTAGLTAEIKFSGVVSQS